MNKRILQIVTGVLAIIQGCPCSFERANRVPLDVRGIRP